MDLHEVRILQPVCARTGDGKKGSPVDPTRIMVRARNKEHLDALVERFPEELGSIEIHSNPKNDYACRLFVDKQVWAKVVAALVEETDYDNFKGKVYDHQGVTSYEGVLHKVWGLMHGYQRHARATGSKSTSQHPAATNTDETYEKLIRGKRITVAEKDESPEFVFEVGSEHVSKDNERRKILGYGFRKSKGAVYIIEYEDGTPGEKTASKANRQYRPAHGRGGSAKGHPRSEPSHSAQGSLPFEHTWWIEPGAIVGGPYPGSPNPEEIQQKMQALVDAGIRLIVNLQQPGELNNSHKPFVDYVPVLRKLGKGKHVDVAVESYPIKDVSIPSAETMSDVLATLKKAVEVGQLAYVHCYGGHGRTATVAGCWMVEQGMTPDDVLETITERRKPDEYLRRHRSPETSEQAAFIRRWGPASTKPKQKAKDKKKRESTPNATAPQAGKGGNLPTAGAADRLRGALLGLAVGDALGTTVEFKAPGTFEPVTDMVGGGKFGLKPGQWTDDTSMALCLAESIVETKGFDPADQMQRYVNWWRHGHLSSNGRCFDIGNRTRKALSDFKKTREPFCGGPLSGTDSGNGSLMRLAPVPVAYWQDPTDAIKLAGESSRTTHGSRECVDACRYFAGLLVGLFGGASKGEVLSPIYTPVPGLWEGEPLAPKVADVAAGSFRQKAPPKIRGTGYVIDSLEAALWAFAAHDSYESAVLAAVNLGNDADTTAAICGQIAGAFWGVSGIPGKWLEKLAMRDLIEKLANHLHELSEDSSG